MFDEPTGAGTEGRLDRARCVNAACDRFEADWGAGLRPLIEDALGDVPESDRPRLLRELLGMELELRRRGGERPGAESYRARFPDQAALVEAAFLAASSADAPPSSTGRVLETLAATVGPLSRVSLPDTLGDDGVPPIKPSSTEMPSRADRNGRYQLFGEIARGGMGAVLRGRDNDLGRDLAVKVLLEQHRDNPELVSRFVEEAQIGGQLQHPGIVPVYELGAFSDRRAYFAMKLVRGRTLAAMLEDRVDLAADRPRFLAVFEHVCQTVAYAHSRGVIHRDLKPSNIMVGGFGEVQVMDWGLAKVLARGDAEDDARAGHGPAEPGFVRTLRSDSAADASQAGSALGTPAYMAPEQAAGAVGEVDERADVFGLGSILCQVLTGHPAYTGRSGQEVFLKASRGDTADALGRLGACGADPDLLSLARECLAAAPLERPRHAGLVAARLTAYLASVQERLRAAELGRVEAQARAQEERKRRRLTVALAGSVLLTVTFGGGGWAHLSRQRAARLAATAHLVNRAMDAAILLRGQARSAGDLAKWSQAVMAAENAEAILAGGEPDPSLRERVADLRAGLAKEQGEAKGNAEQAEKDRQFIDRLEKIRVDRAEHGDFRRTDSEFAAAFLEYGVDPESQDPAEVGRRIAGQPSAVELSAALDEWSSVRRWAKWDDERVSWRRLLEAARAADPDPWRGALRDQMGREDVAALKKLAGRNELKTQPASSLELLSVGLFDRGHPDLAAAVLREARLRRPDDFWLNTRLAVTCDSLGGVAGRADAVRFYTAALAIRPRSVRVRSSLVNLFSRAGQEEEAVAELRAGVGLDPKDTRLRSHLAHLLAKVGQKEEALAELRAAIRLDPARARFQPDLVGLLSKADQEAEALMALREATRLEPKDAKARKHLAAALVRAGRHEEAVTEFRAAIRIKPDLVFAYQALGDALSRLGRTDEAIAEATEAVRKNPNNAAPLLELGQAYLSKGRWAEAAEAFRRAVQPLGAVSRRVPGDSQARGDLASALQGQSVALAQQGDFRSALPLAREAVKVGPAGSSLYRNLGVVAFNQGLGDEAVTSLRRCLDFELDAPTARNDLAEVLRSQQKKEEALEVAQETLRRFPEDAITNAVVGRILRELGRHGEALSALRKGRELAGSDAKKAALIDPQLLEVEREALLEVRIPALLRGEDRPADAAEATAFAQLCLFKSLHAAAARLYSDAFVLDPKLPAGDKSSGLYFGAACAAAQAASGQSKDDPLPDEPARVRLRHQALGWLEAYVEQKDKLLKGGSKAQAYAELSLRNMKANPMLSTLRDEAKTAELPEPDRQRCRAIWAKVDALLEQITGPTASRP